MTFELDPKVVRLTPFENIDGPGGVAAVQVAFGPIHINTKLVARPNGNGYFLSMPQRQSQATQKWYEQVTISDPTLLMKAQAGAVKEYERMQRGELVAV